jgi:hypothetical protein
VKENIIPHNERPTLATPNLQQIHKKEGKTKTPR